MSKKSIDDLGKDLENEQKRICEEVTSLCGVRCFKSVAGFEKIGYYSIVLNVFFSLFYSKIIENIDDSISLCMYFGLLCNGTSNLCSVWTKVKDHLQFATDFCSSKPGDDTCIFHLLTIPGKDSMNEHVGNCKLHRYQFANYSEAILR
jgi:hypothetical protein